MNSRFLLPATVAGAMHLAAFLAYSPTTVVKPPAAPARPVQADPDSFVDLVPETPPPEPADNDLDRPPRGGTLLRPLTGEEPPPVDRPDPRILTEEFRPSPPDGPVARTFVPGAYGVPEGDPGRGPQNGVTIVDATRLDRHPAARSQIAPVYPNAAAADGRAGEVLVEFVVDETGAVHDARVVRSSERIFEEPTLRAVERWRFEPGRRNGRVVRFRMAVPVIFHRED